MSLGAERFVDPFDLPKGRVGVTTMPQVEKKEWLEVGPHKHIELVASNGDCSASRYECKDCAAFSRTLERLKEISCPCPRAPDGKHVWKEQTCCGSWHHADHGGTIYLHRRRSCVHCACNAECFGWDREKSIGSGWY